MEMDRFFTTSDATRAAYVLRKLYRHDLSGWGLTGGIAIELHILRRGGRARERPLHDIDFLVAKFDRIPETLGREFLFRHVHPHDPPAKTLLQGVDSDMRVRVDVFRAYGFEMDRLSPIELAGLSLRMVSLPDLVARHARLCWDLIENKRVAPKYAQDFLRLLEIVTTDEIEDVWREHRRPLMPESFAEAARELQRNIPLRDDLLIAVDYSTDVNEVCLRCEQTEALRLADASQIFSILGYC